MTTFRDKKKKCDHNIRRSGTGGGWDSSGLPDGISQESTFFSVHPCVACRPLRICSFIMAFLIDVKQSYLCFMCHIG